MIIENTIKNPFTACTARDMGYDEVYRYWCDPFELYNLNEEELYTSKTPIVIEGTRGTGKTMILKFLSYWNQKKIYDSKNLNTLDEVKKNGLGVYFRYKADFCNMLSGITQVGMRDRYAIFMGYFHLFISRELTTIVADMLCNTRIELTEFYAKIGELLSVQIENLGEVPEFICERIEKLDDLINMASYKGDWNIPVSFARGYSNFFIKLIRLLENVNELKNIRYSLLIDEYENASEFKSCINTMIKQTDEKLPITYRIGMRPRGLENNSTSVGEEKLQPDRDYLLRTLSYKDKNAYKEFAWNISRKRLEMEDIYKNNNLTDIKKLLGNMEDIDKEASEIADDTKMFAIVFDRKKALFNEKNNVIDELKNDDKLLEMYNIVLLLRDDTNDYKKIGSLSKEFSLLKKERKLNTAMDDVKKYRLGYSDKYRMALLYLMIKLCNSGSVSKRKKYYSFNTFVYLSTGAINDYISLCRNTFNYVNYGMIESLVLGNPINAEIQTNAARQTAEDQMKKLAMSQYDGKKMYSFVDNMGRLFGYYHEDINVTYPETNQFAFEDQSKIEQNEELNKCLVELINCGAVIQRENQQHISIGKKKGNIYWLSRIYSPKYQFSYRTRGGFNVVLSDDMFAKFLVSSLDPERIVSGDVEKEIREQDFNKKNNSEQVAGQMSLWDIRH